jgi:gamma-glutamyltranspeptidase/glutathione hydrolase
MVGATHWLAAAAGMRALERDGNAFDAAVAAGLVLQVVEPHRNGPGGDLPVLLWDARRREAAVLCAQGVAPQAATIGRFRELGLTAIPGNGLLPACVPGAFDGWMLLLRDFGSATVRDVIEPAIHYADHGYPTPLTMSRELAKVERLFREHWTSSAELYLRSGMPTPGSRFRNPSLADTYRLILREAEAAGPGREAQVDAARRCFSSGAVAERIGAFLADAAATDSSGRRHGALLDADDLASWEAHFEPPVSIEYRGHTVLKCGPWSQGPVLLQQLALLEGFDVATMGLGSADLLHVIAECAKLAFADREAWYGDPEFVDVPLAALLSPPYSAARRELVDPARASRELRPGSPDGRVPRLATRALDAPLSSVGLGQPGRTGGDTCHIDVADRFGNLVSATPSGGWLQSSPVIPSLGFPLGTRAQMFSLDPGVPNSLAPGKRPRTTLSPGLALRGDAPYLAFGTPGGDRQDQFALTFLLAHLDFGLDLQTAIDTPTITSSHFPNSFYPHDAHPGRITLERDHDPSAIAELRRRGHDVELVEAATEGWMNAVAIEPDGELRAAASARGGQSYAAGR